MALEVRLHAAQRSEDLVVGDRQSCPAQLACERRRRHVAAVREERERSPGCADRVEDLARSGQRTHLGARAVDERAVDVEDEAADVVQPHPLVEDGHGAGRAVDADVCPVWICDVARPVPTTAGSPYSRHTIAAWDITPPMSVTTALTFVKIGAQAGDVMLQTRISPSRTSAISLHRLDDPRDALDRRPATPALPSARGPPSWLRAHARTRSVVMPQSMFSTGSFTSSGMAPIGGRRSPVREPLEDLLATRDDRRPVLRAERLAARGPHQDELVEGRLDLVAGELEDVLGILEVAVVREQRAELAHLVPPSREEPVVAEELVLLDVREDHPREAEQLVEALARLLVEERTVLLREPVALACELLGRPLDLLALASARRT